jgi:hypothetical protein
MGAARLDMRGGETRGAGSVDLYWLPLGAGGSFWRHGCSGARHVSSTTQRFKSKSEV